MSKHNEVGQDERCCVCGGQGDYATHARNFKDCIPAGGGVCEHCFLELSINKQID